MRLPYRSLTVVALSAAVVAPWARAEDAPDLPRPVPPPRPAVAGLLDRLLAEDGGVRAAAEKTVAKASPDVLRILLLAMRDRAERAEREAGSAGRGDVVRGDEAGAAQRAISQEMRLLDVPSPVAARLLGAAGTSTDSAHRILPAADAQALRVSLAGEPGVKALAAPTLTTYDGQRGTVEVLDRKSYVADFRVEVRGTEFLADPVVETYGTGMRLETRARIAHDGSTVVAALDVDLRRSVDPVVEETLPGVGANPPFRVQRPEIVGWRWTRAFTLPRDRTLVVTWPEGAGGAPGRRLVLLYAPTVVPLEGDLPAPGAPAPPRTK